MVISYLKIKTPILILASTLFLISGTSLFASAHEKLLIARASELPMGNSSIPENCSHAIISSPNTEEGKYVKSKSWEVTSEVRLDKLTFISFVGGMDWMTSYRCEPTESNIAVFKNKGLTNIVYTSEDDDHFIGALNSLENGIIKVLFSDSRTPIAEIKVENELFTLQAVSSSHSYCNGTEVVPNIYNKPVREARNLLLASGWQPREHFDEPMYGARDLRKAGIIEAQFCYGTGLAACELNYDKDDNRLNVFTVGEYDQTVEYYELPSCF